MDVWAVMWSFPSRAKRAVDGRAYHVHGETYPTKKQAENSMKRLRGRDSEIYPYEGWYKGTEFAIVPIPLEFVTANLVE